jgi:hypothetical protein
MRYSRKCILCKKHWEPPPLNPEDFEDPFKERKPKLSTLRKPVRKLKHAPR